MPRKPVPCRKCGKPCHLGSKSTRPDPICRACRADAKPVEMTTCPTCEKDFVQPSDYRKIYCSIECSNKRHCPERVGDPNAAAARRMRRTVRARERRLRHAETWDGITDEEILNRDGWRCQVPECSYRSRKINRRYKYPDPRSPGIDHIVPLSMGGDDTCVNKRAAHHGCNMARGNRMGEEQLPLIGSLREPPLSGDRKGVTTWLVCACGQAVAPGRRKYCQDCLDNRQATAERDRQAGLAAKAGRQDLGRRVAELRAEPMSWEDIAVTVDATDVNLGSLVGLAKRYGDPAVIAKWPSRYEYQKSRLFKSWWVEDAAERSRDAGGAA